MPVVTIEPVEVNLIPYEEGKKTVMEFLLTNHGLIRADNVRFQLPQDSPSLKFTQVVLFCCFRVLKNIYILRLNHAVLDIHTPQG